VRVNIDQALKAFHRFSAASSFSSLVYQDTVIRPHRKAPSSFQRGNQVTMVLVRLDRRVTSRLGARSPAGVKRPLLPPDAVPVTILMDRPH
jgi:hypothetical protein